MNPYSPRFAEERFPFVQGRDPSEQTTEPTFDIRTPSPLGKPRGVRYGAERVAFDAMNKAGDRINPRITGLYTQSSAYKLKMCFEKELVFDSETKKVLNAELHGFFVLPRNRRTRAFSGPSIAYGAKRWPAVGDTIKFTLDESPNVEITALVKATMQHPKVSKRAVKFTLANITYSSKTVKNGSGF